MHMPFSAPCSHNSVASGRSVQPVARTLSPRSCPVYYDNTNINQLGPRCYRSQSQLACHQIRHRSSSRSLTAAVSVANEEHHEVDWASLPYEVGPAFRATLQMLEWDRLCEHLSKHASTALGKRMCQQLEVPVDMQSSIRMLQETRAMLAMENEYMSLLDYGGISTNEAEAAIKRASKGGMVAAKQLRGLVTMLAGADRLKRQVQLVARQNNVTQKGSPLWPLLEAVAGVRVPGALMRDINSAINEDGELADSSSEQVRTTRGKVRAITSRINNILKGFPGEASEKGGRLCVAAPAGTKISNGVMLGSSVGGGMAYIEPPQVVLLNNELAAARAEAMAAEEAVLWELSGRLMGCLEDVETAFSVVGWLDVLSARVRFGMWMGAVMPQLTPWEDVFHRRSGTAVRKQQLQQQQQQRSSGSSRSSSGSSSSSGSNVTGRQQQQQQQDEAVNWDALSTAGAAAGAAVHLRKFSHPLLLADYLAQQQQLEREARLYSGSAASSSNGSSSSSSKKISSRLLGTRKEVVYKQLGLDGAAAGSDSSSGDSELSPEERLAALKPPRPIDLVIQPETSVVVITGPNTGGKTATMKAFGLAVCMAKAGLLVPCQAPARLPCYSSVLADIGDEQSLTANLSTFSGHIKRISAVRAEADGRSLLLLDELGTGTDPIEGAALGLALLKQLIKGGIGNGALTIATTHHSIMTSLKFEDPRAENASVEFDEEKLGPTYKLLWGVPGRSNALNIASQLGLDPDIIAAARTRLAAGVAATNAAIAELEQVQEDVRQADLAAFAVGADLDQKKQRLAAISELAKSYQIKLARKRTAAIMEVAAAARALLKALKLERKAWKQSKAPGKISAQLDLALAENHMSNNMLPTGPAAAAANSLDSALETFKALEQTRSDVTAYDALQQQRRRQLEQQMLQQEEWVQDWARLLSKARATLAASIAAGSSSSGQQESGSSNSSSLEDDDELEAQIMALYATQQAKQQAQRAAAQQVVDSKISRLPQPAAAEQAGTTAPADMVNSKSSLEELVSQELFAAGVAAVENALEHDQQLAALLQAKQAAAEAAEAALAADQARQQAEQAKLVAALEQELDEWEIDLAFFAPDQVTQQQQQQQQQEEDTAAAEAAAAARREEELSMVRAFEDLLDLDGDWSLPSPAAAAAPTAASSGSATVSSSSSSSHGLSEVSTEHGSSAKQQQQQQQQQQLNNPEQAAAATNGELAGAAGVPGNFDDLLDFLELDTNAEEVHGQPIQQQQQQPGRQQRKTNKKKQKPALKFKMG